MKSMRKVCLNFYAVLKTVLSCEKHKILDFKAISKDIGFFVVLNYKESILKIKISYLKVCLYNKYYVN